jgi:hypothetical protein
LRSQNESGNKKKVEQQSFEPSLSERGEVFVAFRVHWRS